MTASTSSAAPESGGNAGGASSGANCRARCGGTVTARYLFHLKAKLRLGERRTQLLQRAPGGLRTQAQQPFQLAKAQGPPRAQQRPRFSLSAHGKMARKGVAKSPSRRIWPVVQSKTVLAWRWLGAGPSSSAAASWYAAASA